MAAESKTATYWNAQSVSYLPPTLFVVIIILPYKNKITSYHEISYFGFNFDRKSN